MECRVEKLEYFRRILLFQFNRRAKVAKAARNICAVYGNNAIWDSTARKLFSRFKEDRFDISDPSCSGKTSGFDEDRFNTLIPMMHVSVLENGQMWWNVTIPPSCDIFIQRARFKNRMYGYRSWPYVHLCLLVIDWLVNNIGHFYPVSLWWREIVPLC